MLVRECLHKAPVTVPPQCTIAEAAALMGRHGVGSLLVVSGDTLQGIVTDRDIAVRGVGAGIGPDEPVRRVMTDQPITIQGSSDIFVAFQILKDAKVRRLPVLEEGDVAGMITVDDLVVRLTLELGAVLSPVATELMQHGAS